ncbi:MAG TPA: M67 family metallopeptidase [Candidatus Acidoferrales bacterium]|nr:M67 family metallopeptidase [Candidatus Acidoferrales bacterium]
MLSLIQIRREVLTHVLDEALRLPNMESCGLLAGSDGIISRAFPATNSLASATAYEISPQELFGIMRDIRAAGLQMLGIYHSHPTGDNSPSSSDISCAYYPDAAYFIISPLPDSPQPVRAYSIRDGRFTELKIQPI